MNRTGRLLFPAVRWRGETGFAHESALIESALRIGVGGFVIFGGGADADAVAELTASVRTRCPHPLLFASDLERGAGQQFHQATPLPPLAAIGSLDDEETTRRAGELTAREARSLGIDLLLAPVADVALEPANPIVGTRALGSTPEHVARHVAAWIGGARGAGALTCAKHFPGHGRTVEDSHATLPQVAASRDELDLDLLPFRAAIDAGTAAVMSAHVLYHALDPDTAATLSPRVLTELLRDELRFDGLVVSDAMNMTGVLNAGRGSEVRAAIAAIHAGCDALLYPSDLHALASALEGALGNDLALDHVERALRRLDEAARQAAVRARPGARGTEADRMWAGQVAARTLVTLRGTPRTASSVELVTIDDDAGGPFPPPSREPFANALRESGLDVHRVEKPTGTTAALIAVHADIRAWKGAPGLSERARAALEAAVAAHGDAVIVLFGHPRLTEGLPGRHVLAAWGGEAIMQRAAAEHLARTQPADMRGK